MPIDLYRDEDHVTMVLLGLITPEQIINAFENIRAEFSDTRLRYIIMEITEMIYQPEVMFAEAVQISRQKLMEHPNILGIVYILATSHPLRDTFRAVYESHGLGDKLFFAINIAEAHRFFRS
jgi:thermostable 8-oxoguanine DNA glycosylase